MSDAERRDLVRRYADDELSIRDLRDAGVIRFIEILSDLAEMGRAPPIARRIGPNVDSRARGMARLQSILAVSA